MVSLVWAVHISDGILRWPWLAGGFVLAGVLVLIASLRVRDEEIPRIALLTAAFFVASLIHVRIGPTSVHLLLNGLVGVLLGRRAPLALLVGLALQAALLGHGGYTTLGVNACVQALPALLAGGLFGLLTRLPWLRSPWMRTFLVAAAALAWTLSLVFCVALLHANYGQPGPLRYDDAARNLLAPWVLALAGAAAVAAGLLERRLDHAPEFPLGLLVGVVTVLATLALNAAVLLAGGAEDWRGIVLLVFAAHLPLAFLEGVILGFTVGFLARVKPEMLGIWRAGSVSDRSSKPPVADAPGSPRVPARTTLLVLLALLFAASPAQAHGLLAEAKIRGHQIEIESWFSQGNTKPREAEVKVYRADNSVLTSGRANAEGVFVFSYEKPETLRVVVAAGAGHQKELLIPREELEQAIGPAGSTPTTSDPAAAVPRTIPASEVTVKDVLVGVSFVLALAAFLLSMRNARQLRALQASSREALPTWASGGRKPPDAQNQGTYAPRSPISGDG